MALELPAEHFEHYVAGPLRQLYLVGVNPSMFQRLYAFRAAIVDAALRQHLMPMALRELRAELRAAAERSVLTDMGDAFWREATMPPLRLKAIADDVRAAPLSLTTMPTHWTSQWRPEAKRQSRAGGGAGGRGRRG